MCPASAGRGKNYPGGDNYGSRCRVVHPQGCESRRRWHKGAKSHPGRMQIVYFSRLRHQSTATSKAETVTDAAQYQSIPLIRLSINSLLSFLPAPE